jgi:hypothetical protein
VSTPRPEPSLAARDGFHFEAVESEHWELATDAEKELRPCHYSHRYKKCGNPVVAGLNRGRWTKHGRVDCWWFYCTDHLYGRWIDDGRVMCWRLVPDEDSGHRTTTAALRSLTDDEFALARLRALRARFRAEGNEAAENLVLDAMDFVTGWCSRHMKATP